MWDYGAGGVIGADADQRAGCWADVCGELIQIAAPMIIHPVDREGVGFYVIEGREFMNERVGRGSDKNAIVWIASQTEDHAVGFGCAGGQDEVIRIHGIAPCVIVLGDFDPCPAVAP